MDVLFFFSSRRRHTRCLSDWSSDVCSSDLHQRVCRARRRWLLAKFPPVTIAVGRGKPVGVGSPVSGVMIGLRSEERRVGKECRTGGSPYAQKRNDSRETATYVVKYRCSGNN